MNYIRGATSHPPIPRFFATGTRMLDGIPERYIYVRMPWRRRMYTINNDSEGMHRPMLVMYWSKLYSGFKFRMGTIPS